MRNAILLSLLALLLFSCEKEISQVQADKFVKFFGSNLMDEAGEVAALSNGGYAICGTINDASRGKRMALILTDKFGNVLTNFPRLYDVDGMESGGSSLVVLDGGSGGFLLSGYVERSVGGGQTVQKDVLLVRVDANGGETWKRSYGSAEDEQVLHSVRRIGSGFMLAGYQFKNGKSDVMVMGVTEAGDSIRLGLNYNNPFTENARANFLLNTGSDYLCVCTLDKTNDEGSDLYVLSFDNELSPLERNLSADMDEYASCVVGVDASQFLVLGSRISQAGNMETVVYSIEKNGLFITNSQLIATISESNADLVGNRMIKTADGRYAIVGTRVSGGSGTMFLQFLSSGFTAGDQHSFGASGVQGGVDLDAGADRGIIMLGINQLGDNGIISLIKTSETGEL